MTRPSADIVKVQWTGTGPGTPITLGSAVTGFKAFPAELDGLRVSYSIEHQTSPEREAGIGLYTHSGTTLTRERVSASTDGDALVSFSPGTKHIRIVPRAEDLYENRAATNPTTQGRSQGYIAGRSRWLNTSTGKLWFCLNDDDVSSPSTVLWDQVVTAAEIGTIALADNSVTTPKIVDLAVTSDKLAANAVIATKILDGAVTTGKVADGGLTGPKLADGAVTTAKIADAQVTAAKLAPGAADGALLGVDAVETVNILDGAVTLPKLADVSSDVLLGRFSVDEGPVEALSDADLTEEATPTAGHFLLGWSGSALRKFDVGELPSGGGGGGISAVDYNNVIDIDTGTTLGTSHLHLQASGSNLNKVLLRLRNSTNQTNGVVVTLPDNATIGWMFEMVVASDQTGSVTIVPESAASTINGVAGGGSPLGGIALAGPGSSAVLFVVRASVGSPSGVVALLKGETDEARTIQGVVTFDDGFTLTASVPTVNFNACRVYGNRANVESQSGTLSTVDSGKVIVTTGNITVPNSLAGFNVTLIAGGAHTVQFGAGGPTSAAMAIGDIMSIVVESSTVIHAVKTASANKVSFV